MIVGPTIHEGIPSIQAPGARYAVELVQRALVRAGFNPGPINGVFGDKTDAAVSEYQATGLVVDGMVGDKSWSFLG